MLKCVKRFTTADFIKKVLSVYTHSMTTIYLSMSTQVAKSTFFMKSPVGGCLVFLLCSFSTMDRPLSRGIKTIK